MTFLSYAYRFLSNFVFLTLVYFSLNFLEKYEQRVMVSVLVLVYAGMHAARRFGRFISSSASSGWRERLAVWRRSPSRGRVLNARKQIVGEVSALRHAGEMKSYIDLLFLALVILLCIAKIVTN